MKWWVALIIVVAVVAAVIAILTILGKRAQKKQEAQREQIEAAKQSVNMLVIDKKKMKLKDAGLPQMVLDNTNKLMQRSKVPVVKAKVGPRVMTFLTDNDVYDVIPLKKEVKAEISGLYIVSVKGIRGSLVSEKAEKKRRKKDSFIEKALRKGRGES